MSGNHGIVAKLHELPAQNNGQKYGKYRKFSSFDPPLTISIMLILFSLSTHGP